MTTFKKKKFFLRKGGIKIKFRPKARDGLQEGALGFMPACLPHSVPAGSASPVSPVCKASSPGLVGLILVSGQPRLDNSCLAQRQREKKGITCLQASHPSS